MCGLSTCEPQYGSSTHTSRAQTLNPIERDFCIDNLLVQIHVISVMIRWTGPAPWEVEFPLLGVAAGVRAARAARHGTRPHGVLARREREFFIDNLLVRIHFIIVMIRWTGPAP